jgi:hypothetical protein
MLLFWFFFYFSLITLLPSGLHSNFKTHSIAVKIYTKAGNLSGKCNLGTETEEREHKCKGIGV